MPRKKTDTQTAQQLLTKELLFFVNKYIDRSGELLDMMEADRVLVEALGRLDQEFLNEIAVDLDLSVIINDWETVLSLVKKCKDRNESDLIELLDAAAIVDAANALPDVAVIEVRSMQDAMKLEEFVNRELSYYNLGATKYIKL